MSEHSNTNHSATPVALGYYFQAVYGLLLLLRSKNDESYVSIETWDDVFFEDGDQKSLHQLKHTIVPNNKISVKSSELWKTLKVWIDYCRDNNPADGNFILATVAAVDPKSPLTALSDNSASRDKLLDALLTEAKRVVRLRKEAEDSGKTPDKLPYKDRYKGCEDFLALTSKKRKSLVENIDHRHSLPSMTNAIQEVSSALSPITESNKREPCAKRLLSWWDWEVCKRRSNTGPLRRPHNVAAGGVKFRHFCAFDLVEVGRRKDVLSGSLPTGQACLPS